LFLTSALALFGLLNAQKTEPGFRLGVNAGLPVGDFGKAYSFTAGADVFESAFAMPSIQKAVDDFSDDWFVIQNSRSV